MREVHDCLTLTWEPAYKLCMTKLVKLCIPEEWVPRGRFIQKIPRNLVAIGLFEGIVEVVNLGIADTVNAVLAVHINLHIEHFAVANEWVTEKL